MIIRRFTPTYQQNFGAKPLTSLSVEEELRLVRRVLANEAGAVEDLFVHGDPVIKTRAKRFSNRGLTPDELVVAGRKGLLRAVEKKDERRLFPYAGLWIVSEMKRAVADNGRNVRIPVHRQTSIEKCRNMRKTLQDRLGREPSDEELITALDITPKKFKNIQEAELQYSASLAGNTLEKTDSFELKDVVSQPNTTQDDLADKVGLRLALNRAAEAFPPRTIEILKLSYGESLSDSEIAELFEVTKPCIWQIRTEALAFLRQDEGLKMYA